MEEVKAAFLPVSIVAWRTLSFNFYLFPSCSRRTGGLLSEHFQVPGRCTGGPGGTPGCRPPKAGRTASGTAPAADRQSAYRGRSHRRDIPAAGAAPTEIPCSGGPGWRERTPGPGQRAGAYLQ